MQDLTEIPANIIATPLLQQYWQIKKQYPDVLLLFQVGDFFELFYEDAKVAAACLSIVLTKRGKQEDAVPLCGVPVASVRHYIAKLIRAGFKVALCEQTEPAVPGKIVARTVTQVFSPGTLTDMQLLDEKSASYICSLFMTDHSCALLFGELLTAQLYATALPGIVHKTVEAEMARFLPDEVLITTDPHANKIASLCTSLGYYVTRCTGAADQEATRWSTGVLGHQKIPSLHYESVQQALQMFYGYVRKNQLEAVDHFNRLVWYEPEDFLLLDSATSRNLELVKNNHDGTSKHTLFEVMDKAVTAMGSRTIKKWILRPLADMHAIVHRQEVVAYLLHNSIVAQQIGTLLTNIADAERVIGRIALRRATFSEYLVLQQILKHALSIKKVLAGAPNLPPLLRALYTHIHELPEVYALLEAALDEQESNTIKKGFDAQLDHFRALINQGSTLILQLERHEQERSGIASLKIRYNSVFGYYIEVTKPNVHLVPTDYVRSQTLVGKERFTTAALKQIETDLLSAQSNIQEREKEIFYHVQRTVAQHIHSLRKTAQALAQMDALYGFAQTASVYGYCKPVLTTQREISIAQGKHPVVAAALHNRFVPNDVVLDDLHSLWIITGPNMGGKSTFLRQVALITLMAHCGSFVPARQATIALCDRIFTRIGASDHVAGGKSTFLVEMEETATICLQATQRSLIIFDEVGRGTSTFDGLAIAQALIEYIHTQVHARTLFATHYHELTALQKQLPGIVCYHAASKRTVQGITLLYTIESGVAAGSFGIEVAKVAQLPAPVVARAQELLDSFEGNSTVQSKIKIVPATMGGCLHNESELKKLKSLQTALQHLDCDTLSPKQAWELLWALKADL